MTNPTNSLDRLIARLSRLIAAATDALEADPTRVDDWYDEIVRQLRRYTLAAYMNGAGSTASLTDQQQTIVRNYIDSQIDYLADFRDTIKKADEWSNTWGPRAQMYARSIAAPWWAGKTQAWPLPAMPGDGTTQCLSNCRCAWRIDELDGDGNADAYWIYGVTEDHCQTCIERSQQWAPLRIRNGELL